MCLIYLISNRKKNNCENLLKIKEIKEREHHCWECGKIVSECVIITLKNSKISFLLCHPCKEHLHLGLIS